MTKTQALMDSYTKPPSFLVFNVILCCFLVKSQDVNPLTIDNHKLIYNQCPNHTYPNPSHAPLLKALFRELSARSSNTKFYETIVADDDISTVISGAFQCRSDLSPNECETCVSKLPLLNPCGEKLPGRVQLSGCYARFRAEEGFESDYSPDQVLHRACSRHKVEKIGFVEMKYAAFSALESGVVSGNGFYETVYESIHVVAQCEGSLRACDCGECVSSAAEVAADHECRYSVSGEVYLVGCFMSFEYHRDRRFGGYSFEDNGIGKNSSKLIAIVIGVLAAILLVSALCFFLRSFGKKKDDW